MISEAKHRTIFTRNERGLTLSRTVYIQSKCLLSDIQQKLLANYINKSSNKGLPPTPDIVRNMAEEINGSMPSKNWVARSVSIHSKDLASESVAMCE
jgi:hypothetical protein